MLGKKFKISSNEYFHLFVACRVSWAATDLLRKRKTLRNLKRMSTIAFIFVKMFNIYKYGKKPYSTYFVEVLVSGKDQLYDKTTDLSFEDRTQLVKHGIESGKIPKDSKMILERIC